LRTNTGLRRWETYVALLAVILGSLSTMAANPRTSVAMIAGAVGLIALVGVSLLRRARSKGPKTPAFDAGERAAQIREQRHRRSR
jgi:hypothetical protein